MRVTGPAQPVHFLLDILDLLADLGVPYSVVGAFAVSLYGIPRSTNDGDTILWFKGIGKTVKDLTARISSDGYDVELKMGDIDDPVLGVVTVKDKHRNRADLLLGVRGMDAAAQSRSITAILRDASISFIGPEDLIAMKVFAGGPKDLEDAKGILQVSGEKLDTELLKNLVRGYGDDTAKNLDTLVQTIALEEE